jgi:regulator of protease activity HflC (stomatin/prohibitin superfamily)
MEYVYIIIPIIIILFASSPIVVPQNQVYIIERLGAYKNTLEVGIYFRVPFIDRVARKISLHEETLEIKHNYDSKEIEVIIVYQVIDAKVFAYVVKDPVNTLVSRAKEALNVLIHEKDINQKLKVSLEKEVKELSIQINMVEVKIGRY